MTYRASRYHDISTGHRVCGHENKCRHLHGHNYRIHFHCEAELDTLGRVIDFGVIKKRLCEWVESEWDHKMLIWESDPVLNTLQSIDRDGVKPVPFNPTAENMAEYLVKTVAPNQLQGTGVVLVSCDVEETRKCSASFRL